MAKVTKLVDYPKPDPEKESKMVEKWLKKHKPSMKFSDEPIGHLTPSGGLGQMATLSCSMKIC